MNKENMVLNTILNRKSIRAFTEQPPTAQQTENLVRAALLAPSSRNLQPWHVVVVQNRALITAMEQEIIQHFVDLGDLQVIESNKARNNKVFYDAPLVFVLATNDQSHMDVGIQVQTIALAAEGMGLNSVILGFPGVLFLPELQGKWQKKLGFPTGYDFGIAIAVGHGTMAGRDREPDETKVHYIRPCL